jgi:hypothetical protein
MPAKITPIELEYCGHSLSRLLHLYVAKVERFMEGITNEPGRNDSAEGFE